MTEPVIGDAFLARGLASNGTSHASVIDGAPRRKVIFPSGAERRAGVG